MSGWRRIAREPALHFVALGVLLFGLHAIVRGRTRRGDVAPIVVSAATITGLRVDLTRTLGRPPTDTEMRARVARIVDDEVLYREATRRGLDRGDEVVRRRLVQRMAFALHEPHSAAPPSDDALREFLLEHTDRYRTPARVSFTQVYFSRTLRGATADADARAALGVVATAPSSSSLGDPLPLGTAFVARTIPSLAGDFGDDFAAAVAIAPEGAWTGPVTSRYGLHLLRVDSREATGVLTLEQARGRVLADYLDARRTEASASALEALRARYAVRIEWPAALPEGR